MKLKNWIIAGTLITGTTVQFSFTTKSNGDSGIGLSNIEALASGESNPFCTGVGTVDCPASAAKVQIIVYY